MLSTVGFAQEVASIESPVAYVRQIVPHYRIVGDLPENVAQIPEGIANKNVIVVQPRLLRERSIKDPFIKGCFVETQRPTRIHINTIGNKV